MNYLFLFLLIFLSLGIYTGYSLSIYTGIFPVLILILLTLVSRNVFSVISLGFLIFFIGLYISPKYVNKSIKGKTVFTECIVNSIPKNFNGKYRFKCKVVNSELKDLINAEINVFIDATVENVFYNTRLAFIGKINSIDNKIFLFPMKNFTIIDNRKNLFYPIFLFRNFLIHRYKEKSLSQDSYFLGLALIFGEKGDLPSETRENFIKTGLVHLLAISGFHVGIFISIVLLVLFFLPSSLRQKILLLILPVYAFLTGFNIPVIRASTAAFLYYLGKSINLRVNPINILFSVAFFILLFFPESLFSAGFQLSFFAALGILLLVKSYRPVSTFEKYMIFPFLVSIVATAFVIPVLIYHFGAFSLSGIFLTPVVVPILYIYIFLSIFNLLTLFSLKPLILLMDFVGEAFLKIVDFLSSLSLYITGTDIPFLFAVFYILILTVVFALKIKNVYKVFVSAVLFLSIMFFSKNETDLKVYVFKRFLYPDILIVNKSRECIFHLSGGNGYINFLMRKNGCITERFLDKETDLNGIHIKKYKKGYIFRYKNQMKLFLKNKNLKLTFPENID